MKLSIAFLPALLALSAVPAVASGAVDTSPTPAPVITKADLRGRFNAMVDELAQKAVARKATRADYNRVIEEIRSVANEYMDSKRAQEIHDKMIDRMNELQVRAQQAQVVLMEYDAFKDLLIDLELEGTLQQVINRAREGKATRLEWAMYTAALGQRADAAKAWNPEIDAIIGRLRAECEKLEKRASEALKTTDFDPVLTLHADVMCHGVTARLSRRALEPKPNILIPRDYDDVKDAVIHSGVPANSEFMRKLEARLGEIRAAAEGGRITRADCDALCTLLMQRARAAVTSG